MTDSRTVNLRAGAWILPAASSVRGEPGRLSDTLTEVGLGRATAEQSTSM
ncbi:hypothetical protein [Spirosoma luteum]|nr:hypothetical protein [Spirosoma luteum]